MVLFLKFVLSFKWEQKLKSKKLWTRKVCGHVPFFLAAYFHGVVYLDESVILNLEFVEL